MNLANTLELYANRKLHGRTMFQGIPISVENRKGSVRKGVSPEWGPWQTKMQRPYGYIRGTKKLGMDGAELDVFLGPDESAKFAYLIMIKKAPDFKRDDEIKIMLGYSSPQKAKASFLQHFDSPRFFGRMKIVPMDKFRDMLDGAEKIQAGGPGSGRHKESADDLMKEHDRIKNHNFRNWATKDDPASMEKMYKMQAIVIPRLLDRVVGSYGRDNMTDLAKENIEEAEKAYTKDNIGRATSFQEVALIHIHERLKSIAKGIRADVGEPGVYDGGYGHIEPKPSFHPPSLRKPKRVPTSDPMETDDSFGDVTKRKEAKKQRDQITKQHTDANMRPLNTTLVTGFPSGTIGGFG